MPKLILVDEVIMVYRGKVENGVVVLEPGSQLLEGTRVRVEPVNDDQQQSGSSDLHGLRQGLLSFSGAVKNGPSDLARNHDHYLHGTPRR